MFKKTRPQKCAKFDTSYVSILVHFHIVSFSIAKWIFVGTLTIEIWIHSFSLYQCKNWVELSILNLINYKLLLLELRDTSE